MKKRNVFLQTGIWTIVLFQFIFLQQLNAKEIHVPSDYAKIQTAIDEASNNDEIIVAKGRYVENLNLKGKSLILRSLDPQDTDTRVQTIIDGDKKGTVITIPGDKASTCTISGFTITKGLAANGGGIGISSFPIKIRKITLSYNDITSNSAQQYGGAVYSVSGTIVHNKIYNNTSLSRGGAISSCSGTISDNLIFSNTASAQGGGISGGSGILEHNLIYKNSAGNTGGGVEAFYGKIQNNEIYENSASSGGGIYGMKDIFSNKIYKNKARFGGGASDCENLGNNIITYNQGDDNGGGLDGCGGNLINNIISYNSSTRGSGGGVSYFRGLIYRNTISYNSAGLFSYGGGLYLCDGEILNNKIMYNKANAMGGGIYGRNGLIANNLIAYNSAKVMGGAIHRFDGALFNNTIVNNSANSDPSISWCSAVVSNCIFWENYNKLGLETSITPNPQYSCIQNWTGGGTGNITDSPQFIDPAGGDFRLNSSSPCIDKGSIYYLSGGIISDLENNARISRTSVDMGCYEYGSSLDSDADLLSDTSEDTYLTDKAKSDTDADSLLDGVEILKGTNPGINDAPETITIPLQYASIQEALFFAANDEIVSVSPGIYKEILSFTGRDVRLTSQNPHLDKSIVRTIIDAEKNGSVITLTGKETDKSIITGFTLVNGKNYSGGGINCLGSYASIERNKIIKNSAFLFGGGIYYSYGKILNNIVSLNSAGPNGGSGGGMSQIYGKVANNIVSRNTATYRGGGLSQVLGDIVNNVIYANDIQSTNTALNVKGGGLFSCDRGKIENNIIYANSCVSYPQIDDESYIPNYSCIQDYDTAKGTGNISDDPEFVLPEKNVFHLKPNSPCIDAGNSDAADKDAALPPGMGTERNDMGVYGGPLNYKSIKTFFIVERILSEDHGTIPGGNSREEADVNGDEIVDISDLVFLLNYENK